MVLKRFFVYELKQECESDRINHFTGTRAAEVKQPKIVEGLLVDGSSSTIQNN